MTRRHKIIVLLGLASVILFSYEVSSQQPQTPKIETQSQETNKSNETNAPPPTVNSKADEQASTPSEDNSKTREEERQIRDVAAQESMAAATWKIVCLTIIQITVGVVTIGFLGWTVFETRRTADAAVKAGEAAALSAKSEIEIQRARLFIEFTDESAISALSMATRMAGLKDDQIIWPASRYPAADLKYRFKNYGKTPAIIREISHGTALGDELPKTRTYDALVPLPVSQILGESEVTEAIEIDLPTVNAAQARSITDPAGEFFWFYGRIIYGDCFGYRRTLDFVWQYSGLFGRMRLSDHRETEEREGDQKS